jgi:hypothetical protein
MQINYTENDSSSLSQMNNFSQNSGNFTPTITEKDTLNFLRKNYGIDRNNWPFIQTENFVRQLFKEYRDILDDHEINEELLIDLEIKITKLVDSEKNLGFICLQKL